MSLARFFLRRTVIEALRPDADLQANRPLPTLAGVNVFDSLADPLDDRDPKTRVPCIVVYTEDDDRTRISQAGPLFYSGKVDVVFALSVIAFEARAKENDADPDIYDPVFPVTDAETEASLDLMEAQIEAVLIGGPSGRLYRQMIKGPALTWHSVRQGTTEEGARIALRTARVSVELQDFCIEAAPVAPLTGLDRLPGRLKAIAEQLPSDVSQKLAAMLAASAPVQPVVRPLTTVALDATVLDPQGVDTGAAHVVAIIELPQAP